MARLCTTSRRSGRVDPVGGARQRPEREQSAQPFPPGEAVARALEQGAQLPPRRDRGGSRALDRAEAGGGRRRHERVGPRSELAPYELAELPERRAARRLDPLVEEEGGELLPARGGDAAWIAP